MLDFLKFRTFSQMIINRLVTDVDIERLRCKANHSVIYQHIKYGIKLECHKSKNTAENEFNFIDILITPHYHFNGYKHNGNDFTPENCKEVLTEIFFSILQIQPSEYNELQLINMEYGINIISKTNVDHLIKGILYYKKSPFVCGNEITTYKITEVTTYKQIKAYDKGIQFVEYPQYGIDRNTLRFEVRSKQAKNIRTLGIHSLNDLLRDEVYNSLAQSILNEWEHILIVNIEPDLSGFSPQMVEYIAKAKEIEFWTMKKDNNYRNHFLKEREKYYQKSKKINNLHRLLKIQIIDKLYDLTRGANSTQKIP